MAITLDDYNTIETNFADFSDALARCQDGLRCCLDVDMFVYEYTPTRINELRLVPLEDFKCKRTIVGTNGTRITIESHFGLTKEDFIDINVKEVDLMEKDQYRLTGVLIPSYNPYFDVLNQIAQYFEMVSAENRNSFVLDESDLDVLKLVPFTLKSKNNKLIVSDIEKEMATKEFDSIIDSMYCQEIFSL